MRRLVVTALVIVAAFIVAAGITAAVGFKYAYEPSPENVISRIRPSPEAYDRWVRPFTKEEAGRLLQTSEGRTQLSPRNGTVKVDDALLRLGRKAFYEETFGNEIFLTDVVGILDGPLRITNVMRAILALRGEGTTNLRVEVPQTITIGGRAFERGVLFRYGLGCASRSNRTAWDGNICFGVEDSRGHHLHRQMIWISSK